MNPKEMNMLRMRFANLDSKISAQIGDFIPEDIEKNKKLYTEHIMNIFLMWLDNYVEDIKFK